TQSFAGGAASRFSFTVNAAGLGGYRVNVGTRGSAFGVANRSQVNVYQILLGINQQAQDGVLYKGNKKTRALAAPLLLTINQTHVRPSSILSILPLWWPR